MSSKWVTTAAEIVEEREERPHASVPHEWMVESSVLQFLHRCTIQTLLFTIFIWRRKLCPAPPATSAFNLNIVTRLKTEIFLSAINEYFLDNVRIG